MGGDGDGGDVVVVVVVPVVFTICTLVVLASRTREGPLTAALCLTCTPDLCTKDHDHSRIDDPFVP